MTTVTRKQREIAQREQLILDVARDILLERGYVGLNMDLVADGSEYSKGTIYHHFSCKEDLVAALTAQTMAVRADLFARAALMHGHPRERMTAIGVADEIFNRLYPEHARTEQICRVDSIMERCSSERQAIMAERENGCHGAAIGIIRDAIAQGAVPAAEDPEALAKEIMFGLWSLAWGARSIIAMGLAERKMEGLDAERVLQDSYQKLLDAYMWRPLSRDWDYQAVINRARTEVFGNEWRQVQAG